MFIHVHLNIYLSPTVFQQHFILLLIFVLFKFINNRWFARVFSFTKNQRIKIKECHGGIKEDCVLE